MSTAFRKANETDAIDLAEVQAASWDAAYRGKIPEKCFETQTKERLVVAWTEVLKKNKSRTILALQCGTIGFVNFGEYRDEDLSKDTVAEIRALYVHPSHFRKGVGKQLTHLAVSSCFEIGYKAVALWVLDINQDAKLFYRKMGFLSDKITKVDKKLPNCELKKERFIINF